MVAGGMKRGEKILFWIFALMGVFAIVSFILLEVFRAHSDKALYPTSTHYDLSAEGLRGSSVVRKAGCTACHRVMRNGTNNGLDLDGIGSKRSVQYLAEFLKNPEATYPKETVDHGPSPKGAAYVAKLPEQDLHALVVFLSELNQCITNGYITMWMKFHRMPDDICYFVISSIFQFIHGM